MVKKIGQNVNEADTATTTTVSVGSSVAVTLLGPRTEPLLLINVANRGNRDLFVRLYPASDDNIKHGITVESGESKDILSFVENYTEEISAIMESGSAHNVIVTSI